MLELVRRALRPLGWTMGERRFAWKTMPFGAIVATCTLVDCRRTDDFKQAELDMPRFPQGEKCDIYAWSERQMGNYELGRFGWVLDDVVALPRPIPFIGRQAFFDVSDELLIAGGAR